MFYFCENAIGILIRIAVNLRTPVGNKGILTILILLIYEHGISFYSFVSSNSFISVLQFSVSESFASLAKFISSYFVLFNTVVSGIIFYFLFLVVHY